MRLLQLWLLWEARFTSKHLRSLVDNNTHRRNNTEFLLIMTCFLHQKTVNSRTSMMLSIFETHNFEQYSQHGKRRCNSTHCSTRVVSYILVNHLRHDMVHRWWLFICESSKHMDAMDLKWDPWTDVPRTASPIQKSTQVPLHARLHAWSLWNEPPKNIEILLIIIFVSL